MDKMYYREKECPWCGNTISVHASGKKPIYQKCRWCRRHLNVSVRFIKGSKTEFIVDPVEFSVEHKKWFNKHYDEVKKDNVKK